MASETHPDLQLESELCRFKQLARNRSRDELVQCVRILGMYLALYKGRFGDIPACDYRRLEDAVVLNDELRSIMMRGIEEAYAMLSLIAASDPFTERRMPALSTPEFIN